MRRYRLLSRNPKPVNSRLDKAREIVQRMEAAGCTFAANEDEGFDIHACTPAAKHLSRNDEIVAYADEIAQVLMEREKKLESLVVLKPPRSLH